jgi:hypothetical protein
MRKDGVISLIEQPGGSRAIGENCVPVLGKEILEEFARKLCHDRIDLVI